MYKNVTMKQTDSQLVMEPQFSLKGPPVRVLDHVDCVVRAQDTNESGIPRHMCDLAQRLKLNTTSRGASTPGSNPTDTNLLDDLERSRHLLVDRPSMQHVVRSAASRRHGCSNCERHGARLGNWTSDANNIALCSSSSWQGSTATELQRA